MNLRKISPVVKFASISAPKADIFKVITNNNKVMYVYDAPIIRVLSEGLGAQFEVVIPPDNAYEAILPNGTKTGLIQMVQQAEADLAVGGIVLNRVSDDAVDVSYPYLLSELSFVTNNPEPHSLFFAIFHPFSYFVWIMSLVSLITVIILFFILSRKKITFLSSIFLTIGSLLEQATNFKIKKMSFSFMFLIWIICSMLLTNSYKSVLLSFLTIPQMVGIRDISDLAKAAKENSVKCFSFKGAYLKTNLLESDIESWNTIGECLERNPVTSENLFLRYSSKKAYFAGRMFLKHFEKNYFISEDSFYPVMYAIPYSKNFCCLKDLEILIHRLSSFGLFQKFLDDEEFFNGLKMTTNESTLFPRQLNLEDMSLAFIILISGWILSFITFMIEHFKENKVF